MKTLKPDSVNTRRPRKIFHTVLVFRCPTELSEQLATIAAQRGQTMSVLIRELLRAGVSHG